MPMRRSIDVVVSGSPARVVDLTVRRPGVVHGMVEDVAAEALLEGVVIRLLDSAGSPITSVVTDATGAYRLEGLAPGAYQVACHVPRGYTSPASHATIHLKPGEELELDFDLEPAGALQGRVVDEDTGEPLVGVAVALVDSVGRVVRTSRSGADGSYEFRHLPEDKYTVTIDEG